MKTMLEKFNECKKALDKKIEAIEAEHQKAIDKAGEEFLNDYKSLVKSASEDEFMKFIEAPVEQLDYLDKMVAIMMRTMKE